MTQSHDNDDSDVDEDEPNNEVFGVATVIKLAKDHVILFFFCYRQFREETHTFWFNFFHEYSKLAAHVMQYFYHYLLF